MIKRRLLLTVFFWTLPAGAAATQFAIPIHKPPSLWPADRPSFSLGLGWLAARAPGLSVEGPGGGWELAWGSRGRSISGHAHADGYILQGRGEPLASGRRTAVGMTSSLEADVAWAPLGPDAPWRVYTGGIVNLTVLSFTGAGSVTLSNGLVRVEPDTATSMTLGVPLGLTARRHGSRWASETNLHVIGWVGGATFFSYAAAGPFGFGRWRDVDRSLAGGAGVGLEFIPWRLGIQLGGSVGAPSGNNDGLTTGWARLAFRFF